MTTTPRDAIAGLSERLRQISEYTGDVADEAASQLDSLLKERDAQAILVQKLQCALAYWLPGVTEAIENETNFRCGDDAQLLAGYEGEFPSECWGDKAIARTDALQARVKELEGTLSRRERDLLKRHDDACSYFKKWVSAHQDATRLQQERDEAYERSIRAVRDERLIDPVDSHDQTYNSALDHAEQAIRRLVGPEKIAAANDGEERSTSPEGKI